MSDWALHDELFCKARNFPRPCHHRGTLGGEVLKISPAVFFIFVGLRQLVRLVLELLVQGLRL